MDDREGWESGRSVQATRHDDDDDDKYIYIYIYIIYYNIIHYKIYNTYNIINMIIIYINIYIYKVSQNYVNNFIFFIYM